MAKTERVYNIPLRKEFQKVPSHRRAKKCITAIRQFLARNMHSEDVKLGSHLNEYIWSMGMKHPPHHIKVDVVKEEDGKVSAELVGAPKAEAKKEEKKEEKRKPEAQKQAAKEAVKEEKPAKPEKAAESKKEEKGIKPAKASKPKAEKPKAEKPKKAERKEGMK